MITKNGDKQSNALRNTINSMTDLNFWIYSLYK